MDWQKVAVDGQNKENRLNDFHEWIALQKLTIRKNWKNQSFSLKTRESSVDPEHEQIFFLFMFIKVPLV